MLSGYVALRKNKGMGRTEELAWLPDIEMMAATTEARSGVVSLEDYPSLKRGSKSG
jgi:hypothetical protein